MSTESPPVQSPSAEQRHWESRIDEQLEVLIGGRRLTARLDGVDRGYGSIQPGLSLRVDTDGGTMTIPPAAVIESDRA